jgi:hypothetical protein
MTIADINDDEAEELAEYRAEIDRLAAILGYDKDSAHCFSDMVDAVERFRKVCIDLNYDFVQAEEEDCCLMCGTENDIHEDGCTSFRLFQTLLTLEHK